MFQVDLKKAQEISPEDKGGELAFSKSDTENLLHLPLSILHINVPVLEICMQAHNLLHFTAFNG